ncbi:MAG: universal stress protein [Bacillota bacterium]
MKKVLLATDASEHSLRAARVLAEMATKDPEVHVTVLHVVPLPEILNPAAAAGAPLTVPVKLDDYLQKRVEEVLTATENTLGLPPERVHRIHVVGAPGEAILNEARQGGYDLVVMGRRGLSPLKELLLGSVSQAVLHGTACPMLIVP